MQPTSILVALATAFSVVQGGSVGVDLFHDGDCKDQFKAITVQGYTCATPSPGWSSMRVNKIDTVSGVLTAYTRNNCGEPTAGSHGYDIKPLGACLKNFGFTANAVSLQD
jgi:hypothetical protein